jgi:hypothetical protein
VQQLELPTVACWCKEPGCNNLIQLTLPEGWSEDKYHQLRKQGFEKDITCKKGHTFSYKAGDFRYLDIVIKEKLMPQ